MTHLFLSLLSSSAYCCFLLSEQKGAGLSLQGGAVKAQYLLDSISIRIQSCISRDSLKTFPRSTVQILVLKATSCGICCLRAVIARWVQPSPSLVGHILSKLIVFYLPLWAKKKLSTNSRFARLSTY